ncbi:hypothetical protein ACFSSC_04640 [Corynebacterium mendelii]|uniref:Uncharacterized protein n=1 Tax=Corynebacterium mendelii TaxID=2765362 RepID=A0A939IWR6_9CORY|nr:hypothetical protein [Corynebacterium mendelii]MBN9643313.1 hypothetical protein [Corynebacterium mendelii]
MNDPLFDDEQPAGAPRWPLAVAALCCIALIGWLKVTGVMLAGVILMLIYFLLHQKGNPSEAEALRTSIKLSAEDIRDVLDEYRDFLTGSEPDQQADRMLHRPALADKDCGNSDIEAFFFASQTAHRFLARLDARLAADLSVAQLDSLLSVTDRRALEIKEAWITARRTALRLGTDYDRRGIADGGS